MKTRAKPAARRSKPASRARGWRAVLGFPAGSRPSVSDIRARHRVLIRMHHTDVSVSAEREASEINAARDEALHAGAFAPNAHKATG